MLTGELPTKLCVLVIMILTWFAFVAGSTNHNELRHAAEVNGLVLIVLGYSWILFWRCLD